METNTSLHSLPSLQAASKAHGADDVARGALPVPTEEHGVAMVLATWQGEHSPKPLPPSFVLHRPVLWIPLPQGAGASCEVGTPAALVAQGPHDDAWVVLCLASCS